MMDDKVCDVCRSYQGRIFTDAEIKKTFPYAEFGYPNIHPNCRCWFMPHYIDEKSMKKHWGITEKMWVPLPEPAKYVLVTAFLALLLEDVYKKCVKKEMAKGQTKEEAERICQERESGYSPARDEVDRSRWLITEHDARYRPLIR